MELKYNASVEDFVFLHMHTQKQSSCLRNIKLFGVFVGILCPVLLILLSDGGFWFNLLVGAAIGGIVGGGIFFQTEPSVRKSVRRYFLDLIGDEYIPVVLTKTDERIGTESLGMRVSFPLESMTRIEMFDEGLILSFSLGGKIFVPKYAFQDPVQFDRLVRELRDSSEKTT